VCREVLFGDDDSEHPGIPYFYDNNAEESSWTHPNEEKFLKLVDVERRRKKEKSEPKSLKNAEKAKNIPKEEVIEMEDFEAEPQDTNRSSQVQVQSHVQNRSKAASPSTLSPPAYQEESEFSPSRSVRALPISARGKGESVTTQSRDRDREKEKGRERERDQNDRDNAAKSRDRDRQIERDSQRDKGRVMDRYHDEIRSLKDTNKVCNCFIDIMESIHFHL
jgi:hypothetical protein